MRKSEDNNQVTLHVSHMYKSWKNSYWKMTGWLVFVLLLLIDSSNGYCDCGRGGLCRVYNDKDPYKGINAEPCSCDVVSAGLFKSLPRGCDEIVEHCTASSCRNGGRCLNAFGSAVCECQTGFEGHSCESEEKSANHVRLVNIWYIVNRATEWTPIISGIGWTKWTEIQFKFDNGRTLRMLAMKNCRKEKSVLARCLSYGLGSDCVFLEDVLSYPDLESYSCSVFLPLSQENSVHIEGVKGPVGFYHNIKIEVVDTVVQHSATYRVFLLSPLQMVCPFNLSFSGCGKTPSVGQSYAYGHTVHLSVSIVFYDADTCQVKSKKYEWTIVPLHILSLSDKHQTMGQTVHFIPSKLIADKNTFVADVKIQLKDILGREDETVSGSCYFNVTVDQLEVSVLGANQNYSCGVDINIVLESITTRFPEDQLQYSWCCEGLCEMVELNKKQLKLTTNAACGVSYKVYLVVKHAPSNQTAKFEGTLHFSLDPYNILLNCQPSCSNVNPLFPIVITAKEHPDRGNRFDWSGSELENIRDSRTVDWVLLIKAGVLRPDSSYTLKVRTKDGGKRFLLVTAQFLEPLDCKLSPNQGSPIKDLFNISCRVTNNNVTGTSPPLSYYISEGIGPLNLVAASSGPIFHNLRITQSPVRVYVMDSIGRTQNQTLDLKLNPISEEQSSAFKSGLLTQFKKVQDLYHEKDYLGMTQEIDIMTRQMTGVDVGIEPKIWLMEWISRIQVCYWVECAIQTANAIRRLTSIYPGNLTGNLDRLILKAGGSLLTLTKSLELLVHDASAKGVEAYVMQPVLEAIHTACMSAIVLQDQIIFHPLLDENTRRRRFRRVQEGNTFLRRAIAELGLFIAGHIPFPSPPFELTNTEGRLTVLSNYPEYIYRDVINKNISRFQYTKDVERKLKGTPSAVAVMRYKKSAFWWCQSIVSTGEALEVHVYSKKELKWAPLPNIGPVTVHVVLPLTKFSTITGQLNSAPTNTSKVVRNGGKYMDVYHIRLPRGFGALYFLFTDHIVNLVRMYCKKKMPDVSTVLASPILTSNEYIFTYYANSEDDAYLGLSPITPPVAYAFNISLIKCVTRFEDRWKSENCQFHHYSNGTVTCLCDHMSLINVEMLIPKISRRFPMDWIIFTELKINWYPAALVGFLFIIFGLLLIYAHFRDKKDAVQKTAIYLPDNYPGDKIAYLVGVYTGERCLSGTSSHVAIRLYGTRKASRVHILKVKDRKSLQQGRDDWFIMFTLKELGPILRIELWHDNYGITPDWYCEQVVIYALGSEDKYIFHVNRWITVEQLYAKRESSVIIERSLEGPKPWTSFIGSHISADTRENHVWASIFMKHPRSYYSHLERVIICTVLMFVTILISMMFFEKRHGRGPIDIPSLTFSLDHFLITLYTVLITFIITLPSIFLFSRAKYRRMKDFGLHLTKEASLIRKIKATLFESVRRMPVMTEKTYSQRKRRFNYWACLGWTVSLIIICGSSLGIIWYGSVLGTQKTSIWLITFVLAVLGQALLMDLARVVLIAILVAYFVRISTRQMEVNFVKPDRIIPFWKYRHGLDAALQKRTHPMYKPPLMSNLRFQAAREVDIKWRMYHLFNFLTVVLFALLILLIISNLHVELNYHKTQQLTEHFTRSKSSKISDLMSVRNRSSYYEYIRGTLLPALHHITWYNGRPLHHEFNEPIDSSIMPNPSTKYRGYCADYATKLIGVPRLRLKRVSPNWSLPVAVEFRRIFQNAYGFLTNLNEDQKTYRYKWHEPSRNVVYYRTYEFSQSEETRTGALRGPSSLWYSGSGYVQNLHWSLGISNIFLVDLEFDGWLDTYSRAVFFSFNLYNTYIDKIATVTIITDCLPSGIHRSAAYIDYASMAFGQSSKEATVAISLVFVAFVLILHLIRFVVLIARVGFVEYTLSWAGFIDIALFWTGLAVIVAFGYRSVQFYLAIDELDGAARDVYTPLYSAFLYNTISLIVTGIFCVCIVVFGTELLGKIRGFEPIRTALGLTPSLITTFVLMTLIAGSYISANYYFFGAATVPNAFHVIFFKETTVALRTLELVGPSAYTNFLMFSFLLLIFFFQVSVAMLVRFFAEAAVMTGPKPKAFRPILSDDIFASKTSMTPPPSPDSGASFL